MRDFGPRIRSCGWHAYSLADTKLAEHGVENLFHVDYANDFTESAQGLIQVNRNVLRRQCFAHGHACAIAEFQRPAQAIAMASIDRDCAFWSEILLPDARQNFDQKAQSRSILAIAIASIDRDC